MIPYTVTIAAEEIDRELPGKLLQEAEGILAWLVEGAKRWYAEGLGRPPEIEAAVRDYRDEMNQIGRFLDECCIRLPNAQVKGRLLHLTYKKWADDAGEFALTETAFGRRMKEEGFPKRHSESGATYEGVGLRT